MKRILQVAILLTIVVVGTNRAIGQDPLSTRPASLLLRNGEVLQGRVSFEGDYCAVILERGEIRLRRDQISAIESSLEDIYIKHIHAKAPAGLGGHIERASWCLRHELLGYAATDISAASRIAPNSQKVRALAERLAAARRPRTAASLPEKTTKLPSPNQQQNASAKVDAASLATFTVAVQPLLLNRCANAGCHGKNATNEFRLRRGVDGRPISRALTLSNLVATLPMINRDRPSASRLLTTPIRPHAGEKQAVFLKQHRKQFDLLATWVEQLATSPDSQPAVADSQGEVAKTKRKPTGIRPTISTLARPLRDSNTASPSTNATDDKPSKTEHTTSIDPHDPEIFNHRFFKKHRPKKHRPKD